VVETNSLVNSKVLFDRAGWKRRGPTPSVWREQLQAYARLRRAHFDIGIDLQGHSKTALALRIASPKHRVAVRPVDALSRMLNPMAANSLGPMHMVDENLLALSRLGPFSTDPRWVMPSVSAELPAVKARLAPNKPLATITVSTGHRRKNYDPAKWARVADAMVKQGYQVAYLGGPGDGAPHSEVTTDLVGRLSLAETMAAVAMSQIHFAADTGTGHIAAAYGVPIVSVFGATDPRVYRPYSKKGRVIDLKCHPSEVPPELIVEAGLALLEENGQPVSH